MSSDQMPAPGKIKLIKFPTPVQEKTSNARGMPGVCPGGGDVEASIWLIHNCSRKSESVSFSLNVLQLFYPVLSAVALPIVLKGESTSN